MTRAILLIAFSFLCSPLLFPQNAPPERRVEGNAVTSERDPAMRIELPNPAQYLGAGRWVLYGIADCELHAFAEADGQKDVQRLYWVQFEQYRATPTCITPTTLPNTQPSAGPISTWTLGFERGTQPRHWVPTGSTSRRWCVPRVIECQRP
jgi:hypothetical protein